jgi:Tfp pilus assembly major pilin PilA
VFSKVGDSLSVAPQFLTPFAAGSDLRDYSYLQEALNFYSAQYVVSGNSFGNVSQAAKGGWSTLSLVATSAGDKTVCGPSETPTVCEYRLSKPAVALILIGTNDVAVTDSETFRTRLRRIVDLSTQAGVIPVLSTLPDYQRTCCSARIGEMNALITQVAREADVPLLDLWSALQALPNTGLSSDGIHLSATGGSTDFTAANLQYGYTLRNLLSLQVLDMLWREVMY